METADLMEKSSRSYRLHALSEKPEPDNIEKSREAVATDSRGFRCFLLFCFPLHYTKSQKEHRSEFYLRIHTRISPRPRFPHK